MSTRSDPYPDSPKLRSLTITLLANKLLRVSEASGAFFVPNFSGHFSRATPHLLKNFAWKFDEIPSRKVG
jgi:hypothetical protein